MSLSNPFKAPGKEPPSAAEKASAKIGAEQWNDYVTRFIPQNEAYLRSIELTPEKRRRAGGQALADVEVAMGRGPKDAYQGGLAAGLGRGVSARLGSSARRGLARARGLAKSGAFTGSENAELMGLRKMASLGRNLGDDASAGLGSAATAAASSAMQNAKLDADSRGETLDALGTVAGGIAQRRSR